MTRLQIYDIIKARREDIIANWQDTISAQLGTEPGLGSAAARPRPKARQFANPIEHVIEKGTDAILAWLIDEEGTKGIRGTLEEMCKLRAIQGLSPAEALGFIFLLKDAIFATLAPDTAPAALRAELKPVDRRIDSLMLSAFDEYVRQRARITQIRVEESARLQGRGVA